MAALDQETKGLLREYFSELLNEWQKNNSSKICECPCSTGRTWPGQGGLKPRPELEKFFAEYDKKRLEEKRYKEWNRGESGLPRNQ